MNLVVSSVAAGTIGAILHLATRPRSRSPFIVDRDASGHAFTRRRRRVVAAASTVAAGFVFGSLLVCAGAIAVFAWRRLRPILTVRRERRRVDAALPDAIEMLVLVVHTGMTPHQAILLLEERAPAPVRPAFAEVRRRTDRGEPLSDALAALPEHLGPGAGLVADALAMAERYGTPIGAVLGQLSNDVRERRRRTSEAEARKLPIRMSFPLVACTLPSFVLLAIVPAVLAALGSLTLDGI